VDSDELAGDVKELMNDKAGSKEEAEEVSDVELNEEDYELEGEDGKTITVTITRQAAAGPRTQEDKVRDAIRNSAKAKINFEKASARFELVVDRAVSASA
jgi:hypothetical protein